jgi:DNA polymerase III delta prime subunit
MNFSSFHAASRRPCIILDEIDGVHDVSPVLRHAVQYESSQKRASKTESGKMNIMENGEESTQSAKASYQKRIPIICICNDLYSHALFELRKKAVVVNMGRYMSHGKIRPGDRLQRRLNEICTLEKIDVDVSALVGLIHKSHHDLRSCLHTLQFLSSTGKKITKEIVEGVSVASKDVATSLFQKWERVFWTRAPGNCKFEGGNVLMHCAVWIVFSSRIASLSSLCVYMCV